MDLTISSPVLVKNLSGSGISVVGEVVRQNGRQIEISVGTRWPMGTAVSIETDASLLLGHVVALDSAGVEAFGKKLSCLVHLDQSFLLAKCHWPNWVVAQSNGVSSKQEEVLVK